MENQIVGMENQQIADVENYVVTEQQSTPITPVHSVIKSMGVAYKLAKTICTAENIPINYRNKPADCMIAIDMADRMGVSPMFVFQNMYTVKGKPSWSGQACKALIDNCGKFRASKHVYFGEGDNHGCYVEAVRLSDGETVRGVAVTIAMAKAEGWYGTNKKWQNMPDLMLAYRAASFFARVNCPEALMGCSVEGEADDIAATSPAKNLSDALKGGAK